MNALKQLFSNVIDHALDYSVVGNVIQFLIDIPAVRNWLTIPAEYRHQYWCYFDAD